MHRPPDDVPPTDQELIVAARDGSEAAWATLVERTYPPLRRYLATQTGDPELAADLTQEVFLAALVDLKRAPMDCPFVAWLHGIARHRLQRVWRRRGLRRFVSLERLLGSGAAAPSLTQPDTLATTAGERDLVQRVLDELGPSLREALLLHGLTGLTAREVAQVQGISLAAAERRISRARAQFRAHYNASTDG